MASWTCSRRCCYLVQNHYVEPPDNEKLIHGAIDGMLRTLDPHTLYLPPQRAQRMDEEFHGEYSGIGIQFEIRDGVITVISPLEGTPAYRLGIRAGDRIVEIDSKPVPKTVTNDDVFKALRGPSGSIVALTIDREGEEEHKFSIERAKIPIESVPYAYMIRPGVGYVRIIRFSQTTGEELERALSKLHAQGMKSMVLDLRAELRAVSCPRPSMCSISSFPRTRRWCTRADASRRPTPTTSPPTGPSWSPDRWWS